MVKTAIDFIVSMLIMVPLLLLMTIIYSLFVMLVWNISIPYIFNITSITWLQAWCLTVLSHVFFKGTIRVKRQ